MQLIIEIGIGRAVKGALLGYMIIRGCVKNPTNNLALAQVYEMHLNIASQGTFSQILHFAVVSNEYTNIIFIEKHILNACYFINYLLFNIRGPWSISFFSGGQQSR